MSEPRLLHRELTLEEWAELPEDEPGELVDGRLEEEEMPSGVHELVGGWFVQMLSNWLVPRGGFVLTCDAKYAVAPRRGRKPDVSVYLPGRARTSLRASLLRKPPSIAVEIVTPTPRDVRRDRIEKSKDYAAAGVSWYWLVDPEARTMEVLELGADGRYTLAAAATAGHLVVPGCEGLSLDLDALWAHVDRWIEEAT